MNKRKIDLCLFGEEEDCAAEQTSHNEEKVIPIPETDAPHPENNNVFERIASALGVEGMDEEAILREIAKRKAYQTLLEEIKRRNAERSYKALISQADRLSSRIGGFDLKKELSDRRFGAMLHSGLSLEEAWRAVHFDSLLAAAEKKAEEKALAKALEKYREASDRPEENGKGSPVSGDSRDRVASLSGRGIRDILKRVENGAKIKF